MALTPEKREALKLARARIESRQNMFICHALNWVQFSRPDLKEACVSLKLYIAKQISPERSLGMWQLLRGFGYRSDAQRRLDRLAWIDWMLDEPKEA